MVHAPAMHVVSPKNLKAYPGISKVVRPGVQIDRELDKYRYVTQIVPMKIPDLESNIVFACAFRYLIVSLSRGFACLSSTQCFNGNAQIYKQNL